MRKKSLLPLLAVAVILSYLSSCTRDRVTETYTFFRPIYKTREEVKANIKSSLPQPLSHPGKLFVRGTYVYLNELNKGVHIIDYSNPALPKNIGFVEIPGNVDIAVRGNYLYADCYTDLVTVDITNPADVQLKGFIEGVFPHRIYDAGFYADTSKVITEWVRVDTVVKRRYDEGRNWGVVMMDMNVLSSSAYSAQFNSSNKSLNGTGGSLARFALYEDRMYAVSYSDLKIFNTTNAAVPVYVGVKHFSQGDIETVFPYQDKLFIGSQTGMFVYSLSSPDNPQMMSAVSHFRSCDPVIADGDYAYVTLRAGASCGGNSNQLDVIDISNITSPFIIRTYLMSNPAGLSKDGNTLLVCDGPAGLKFYDAANPSSLTLKGKIQDILPYDVIALNGLALAVAQDGLYFINYSNPAAPVVTGMINVLN